MDRLHVHAAAVSDATQLRQNSVGPDTGTQNVEACNAALCSAGYPVLQPLAIAHMSMNLVAQLGLLRGVSVCGLFVN